MSDEHTHDLEHFYEYGEVYETIETCDDLDQRLGRLKRQHLLDDDVVEDSKRHIAEVRENLEESLPT